VESSKLKLLEECAEMVYQWYDMMTDGPDDSDVALAQSWLAKAVEAAYAARRLVDEPTAEPSLPWLPMTGARVEGEALLWQTHNGQGWAVHQPPQAHYWKPGMTHYMLIRPPDKTAGGSGDK
jgi:hypothetical protein